MLLVYIQFTHLLLHSRILFFFFFFMDFRFLFDFYFVILSFVSVSQPFSLGSCVPGAGLFDFPRWLGCRGHPGYVRRGDRKVHTGKLFSSLGLHTGHHRHPRCSHPVLSCFCPRKPPERLYAR